MKKISINPLPQFFDRYINLVEQDDLFDGFDASMKKLDSLDLNLFRQIGDLNYQDGKWTTKEVIQHIIDNERIQAYRALRLARKDTTPLPGYDENLLGKNSKAGKRTIDELIEELKTVRITTFQLFKSFDIDDLNFIGTCSGINISALSLGFVIIGHQQHHLKVIEEKYVPLAGNQK